MLYTIFQYGLIHRVLIGFEAILENLFFHNFIRRLEPDSSTIKKTNQQNMLKMTRLELTVLWWHFMYMDSYAKIPLVSRFAPQISIFTFDTILHIFTSPAILKLYSSVQPSVYSFILKQWAVYLTSPQSYIFTFSYSLTTLVTFIIFWLVSSLSWVSKRSNH